MLKILVYLKLCFITAVKRLMKEAQELREPTEQFHAQPLEVKYEIWVIINSGQNISILHLSCRTSDLQFSLVLQAHLLVL